MSTVVQDRTESEGVTPSASRDVDSMGRAKPIKGHAKQQLLRDLALGELTYEQLAEKYGRHRHTIQTFVLRNRQAIEEVRKHFENELIGLWVADKYARIAELQQHYEDIIERIEEPGYYSPTGDLRARDRCIKILREVAEELGHIPTRGHAEPEAIILRHEVVGVDLNALVRPPAGVE